jgi:ribonuclease HII
MKVPATFEFEKKLWSDGYEGIAGIDEVGRGSWAGPVVAAAVIFPSDYSPDFEIFDSKLLLPDQRQVLAEKIGKSARIGFGLVDVSTIDKIGIGKASQLAFKKAAKSLIPKASYYLIDAFYIKGWNRANQQPIKSGDRICASIAAASVVAKVYRDSLMEKMDEEYPGYGFAFHKGYGTSMHQKALKDLHFSPIHRRSFNLAPFV